VRALALALVVTAAWLPAATANVSAGAAAAARVARCRPPRREVVRRGGGAVLFVRQTGPSDGKYGAPHSLYACAGPQRPPVDLFDFEDGDTPGSVLAAFNGSYVAFFIDWEAATCVFYRDVSGAQSCDQTLFESASLRTGRTRAAVEGPPAQAPPTAVVVTHAGWIAWSARAPSGVLMLFAQNAAGERTLDAGPVDAGSLTASGARVRWTDAGVARSATL